MASSMLAGERRWASARKGGMTVLGKVAVPKPLNLPSQRLENHGLDPNVEIVPKGTLSWGNRSSSSTSNAWSSSMQSPNADGGTSSPSHLSARPSSSGSCTRPSSAGSDRAHEPATNAWSSNSRPSSASGTFASNHTSSTSLRPRSAETRPNSSQLSRFAEPTPESSVAWGPSNAADRLGMKPFKEDGFSLSSGDFPTLGSDRDNSVKNVELPVPIDHGPHDHPSSVSDRMSQAEGKNSAPHDVAQSGTNRWNRDGTRNAADMEKWQDEPQQYYHPNVPPQHFDSWRGVPMNTPPGVWYRGPPGRGPPGRPSFGAPVGPGGFPMEPFPYHRPQVVPVPLGGSQPVPPPAVGPRGPHPKNGDLYRAQMPDAYARPAMPFRPGFYPGPMPFDNYYGPPMGYCNAGEREIPYMGRAAGPPVFNRFHSPNAPDPSYSHGRPDGRGSMGKTLLEKVETDNLKGAQGFHSVPLKNQKEWDMREEGESWEQNLNASYHGKDGLPLISSRKSEWGADDDDDDDDDVENDIFGKQMVVDENASRSIEDHSPNTLNMKSLRSLGNVKAVDNNWTETAETVASLAPENPRRPSESERDSSLLAPTKDSALMQKIEVLNAKARATDGRNDIPPAYSREEQRRVSHVAEANANNSTIEAGSTAGSSERTASFGDIAPAPHKVIAPAGDKMSQSTALVSRRAYHGGQGRVDYRGKLNFVSQIDDGLQKKFDVITASTVESSSDSNPCDTENLVKDGGQSCAESNDSTDIQAQRAKMRETAKQRALQLQKEEEERTREQKAKALAKLEELNRRTQASEAGIQKSERTQGAQKVEATQGNDVILIGQEVLRTFGEQVTDGLKFHDPGPTFAPVSAIVNNDRESGACHAREFDNISRDLPREAPRTSHVEGISHGECSILKHDSYNTGASNAFEHTDEKEKYPSWTNFNEKSSSIVTGEAPKDLADASVNEVPLMESASDVRARGETNAPNASNIIAEPSTKQKRKNNRNNKNKERLNEAAVVSPIPPVMLDETNLTKECVENEKSKALFLDLDSSVSPKIEPDGGVRASEVQPSLHDEEAHTKVSKHLKPHARRMPRSQQANRNVDKFHSNDTVVWAPVRPQSKVEGAGEAIKKPAPNSVTPAKVDNLVQNSSKGKRAEMERYVPKPVAKELAQQGSTQPMLFSSSPTPEEATDKAQPESARSASPPSNRTATGIGGSGLDSKDGDGWHGKQGKPHGTWRQRNTELNRKSTHHGPSATTNPSKDIQESTDQRQFVKREVSASKSEPNTSWENNLLISGNISNDIVESAGGGNSLAVKDQVATGRGKRYPPKGNKSTGNNHDPDHTDLFSSHSAATDVKQTDIPIPSKERHGSGERISSQWQPKSHRDSDNQKRGRASRTETVDTETDRSSNRDHRSQRKMHVPPQHPDVSDSNMANGPNVGQHEDLFSGRKHGPVKDVGPHQEPGERKPAAAKGRPHSPKQVPIGVSESAPAAANIAGEHDHKFSSGFRRNANQNNRSARGHESHGDWSSGYDNQQHNVPAFRERQRQNVQHYEYQPVQQYRNSKTDKHGAGSNDAVPRYRERNESLPKRDGGNFHRRQGGRTWVDSGHE